MKRQKKKSGSLAKVFYLNQLENEPTAKLDVKSEEEHSSIWDKLKAFTKKLKGASLAEEKPNPQSHSSVNQTKLNESDINFLTRKWMLSKYMKEDMYVK